MPIAMLSCVLFCVDLEKFRRSGFLKHKNATVGSYLVCITITRSNAEEAEARGFVERVSP